MMDFFSKCYTSNFRPLGLEFVNNAQSQIFGFLEFNKSYVHLKVLMWHTLPKCDNM